MTLWGACRARGVRGGRAGRAGGARRRERTIRRGAGRHPAIGDARSPSGHLKLMQNAVVAKTCIPVSARKTSIVDLTSFHCALGAFFGGACFGGGGGLRCLPGGAGTP